MPGPMPKPTKLKILAGNPGHQRLNLNEPEPKSGIPTRPEWLLPEAKREWVRVAGELDRLGLLTLVDRGVLAAYCQAWARWVEADKVLTEKGLTFETATGYVQQRPEVSIAQKQMQLMLSAGARLGLDPASRSRLSVPGEKEDDLAAILSRAD